MRFLTLAIIPVFAAALSAQYPTRTTTTKTTWQGALVDADCQKVHVERRETSRHANPDRSVTTRSQTTHTETVECPATTTTSTFGVLTPDGRLIRFDERSNARVTQIVNANDALSQFLAQRSPSYVRVIGAANGDVAIVESLNPVGAGAVTVTESTTNRAPLDAMFDVRHDGDSGKLVITETGVSFENVSDSDDSRSWSYSEIRELEREGDKKIEIEPYSGDSFEFRLEGPGMTDTVYQAIADRIVAARAR